MRAPSTSRRSLPTCEVRSRRGWARRRAATAVLHAFDGVDLELRRGEIARRSSASPGRASRPWPRSSSAAQSADRGTASSYDGEPAADPPRPQASAAASRWSSRTPTPRSTRGSSVGPMLRELLLLHDVVPAQRGARRERSGCWTSSASRRTRSTPTRASSPAASGSGWPSPGPSPCAPTCSSPTSRSPRSTSRCRRRSSSCFASLQRELGLSILFVAHNLAVVQHLSHRVAVMYLGRIVEVAETAELFANPRHPYTRALIDSIPRMTVGRVNERVRPRGRAAEPVRRAGRLPLPPPLPLRHGHLSHDRPGARRGGPRAPVRVPARGHARRLRGGSRPHPLARVRRAVDRGPRAVSTTTHPAPPTRARAARREPSA